MSDLSQENAAVIKKLAESHGFDHCGIAKAEKLEEESDLLEQWLKQKYQGKMGYMENHFEKRVDPRKLVPGAKSVISLIYNYYPKEELNAGGQFKIARYAYGRDYHFVIKSKLKSFLSDIRDQIGEIEGRIFVDSAPVLERQWAAKSGIGWLGKNTLLLNPKMGSYFFLAELIIDLELQPDQPIKDYCGSCTRCLDACPTNAFAAPYLLDASKCISYLTIELRDQIPDHFKDDMQGWIFGCDICQEVCPWNRFSKPHHDPELHPSEAVKDLTDREFTEMTEDVFNEIFKDSALKRTKWKGLKRNIDFVKSS